MTFRVPGKLFPSSDDTTSIVHVVDVAVDSDFEPEQMLPIFTLPKLINTGSLQPLSHADDAEADMRRHVLSIQPENQRGLLSVIDDEDTFRIYVDLKEEDTVTEVQYSPSVTCDSQQFVSVVQSNTGKFIYKFSWSNLDEPDFNVNVTTGNLCAVVNVEGERHMLEKGEIVSYTRDGIGSEYIEIELEVDLPETGATFFVLINNEFVPDQNIIQALIDKKLIEGLSNEVLPLVLTMLQKNQLRLLGFLGPYQPHQFLLGPPLNRVLVAVVLEGPTTILTDPQFLDDCHPLPGDIIYMIASVPPNNLLRIEFLYATEKYLQVRLQMLQQASVAALCCPIGIYILDNQSVDGISVTLLPNLPWGTL